MQRVEIAGRRLERAGVKLVGLAQAALLVQRERLSQHPTDVDLPAQGFRTHTRYMLLNALR